MRQHGANAEAGHTYRTRIHDHRCHQGNCCGSGADNFRLGLAFTAGLVARECSVVGALAILGFTAGLAATESSAVDAVAPCTDLVATGPIGTVAVSCPLDARAKGLVINIISATVGAGSSSGSNVDA
jgi:hypothetical protein